MKKSQIFWGVMLAINIIAAAIIFITFPWNTPRDVFSWQWWKLMYAILVSCWVTMLIYIPILDWVYDVGEKFNKWLDK